MDPQEIIDNKALMQLELNKLINGMSVRYRTSRRDNEAGTAPEYSEWKQGTLYVARREIGYKRFPAGEIITLTINDIGWAEYSQKDYYPEFNEWLAEEYRLEFEPI